MNDDAGNGLPGLGRVLVWFNDPANWSGPTGLLERLLEHIVYTGIVMLVAGAIAIPLGILIGHTGRGVTIVAGLANALRAIPGLGLLVFLVILLSPLIHADFGLGALIPRGSIPYFVPALIVLVILAIPPMLTATYAGVQAVDPAARDAAEGMGMNGVQVVLQIELPSGFPLIMSGVRSSALQVIASLTVAAYAPLVGGLGRFIVDGDQNLADPRFGYPAMVAAGLSIAVLAVVVDLTLAFVQRLTTSPGISRRALRHHRPRTLDATTSSIQSALRSTR
jgi:osmoprotectant transport system permease protein